MQPNILFSPDQLGSPEHLAWMEENRLKRSAAARKQGRRVAAIGRPWPKRIPPEVKPDPFADDYEDVEEG